MNARGIQPQPTTMTDVPQVLPLSETVEAATTGSSLRGASSPLTSASTGGRALRGSTFIVLAAMVLIVFLALKLRGAVITA